MSKRSKPTKPYPDFPLFSHWNGQWAKKIRKRLRYFGAWDDWRAALARYERERDALYAGRDPSGAGDSLTVEDGCNAFLEAKLRLLHSGDIAQVSYDDYERTCRNICDSFGRPRAVSSLVPADFDALRESSSKRLGPVALGNEINRVRMVFKYLDEADLVEHAVKFGPHFRRPSARVLRLAKERSGSKLVTQAELHTLLAKANSRLKAMILLGLNCGMGNADIGHLRKQHLDLKRGWLNYPRPKTGIPRRAKLWPETVKAIAALPERRAVEPEHTTLVFLTQTGRPWSTGLRDNPITKEFVKLVTACKLKRAGLGFYSLRHTFQTIGEESKDIPAVKTIMGHAPAAGDMSSVYRQAISDERLEAVSQHVRSWWKRGQKVSRKVS